MGATLYPCIALHKYWLSDQRCLYGCARYRIMKMKDSQTRPMMKKVTPHSVIITPRKTPAEKTGKQTEPTPQGKVWWGYYYGMQSKWLMAYHIDRNTINQCA